MREPHTIFDTSAIIGLTERRSPALIDIAKELGRPITRSITVFGELRHGAARADREGQPERERTLAAYEKLSEWSDVEVPLAEVAQAYGDVSAAANQADLALGMNDRWIVAECITQQARLVTGDRRQARVAELVAANLGASLDVLVVD